MLIAILALAMIIAGIAATSALIAGWSVLAAMAIYSGTGTVSVLIIAFTLVALTSPQTRKTGLLQTEAVAGN